MIVASPILSPEMRQKRRGRAPSGMLDPRPNRVYADLPSALARFRFAPPQVCKNLYIADLGIEELTRAARKRRASARRKILRCSHGLESRRGLPPAHASSDRVEAR